MAQLTKSTAEARIVREMDAMRIKDLTAKVEYLKNAESTIKNLEANLKAAYEVIETQKIQHDSLENELRAVRDSNLRLTEMVANSKEFAIVAKLATTAAKQGKDEYEDIRYLKGSGGLGKKDLKAAISPPVYEKGKGETKSSSLRKFHWTYKFWDKLSSTGRLEEEDMLWCPERAVEIVKAYDKGKFSMNTELAIEKLLFEVGWIDQARQGV